MYLLCVFSHRIGSADTGNGERRKGLCSKLSEESSKEASHQSDQGNLGGWHRGAGDLHEELQRRISYMRTEN